jgi:hypothetical protein
MKATTKASRTFADGACHHRDASGKPDCRKKIEGRGANLCPTHQAQWAKAARERVQARKAAAPKAEAKVVQLPKRANPPAPERKPVAGAAMVAVEPEVKRVDRHSSTTARRITPSGRCSV